MPPIARLFPPLSLKEVLEELASFSDPEFEKFLAETQTLSGFDSSQERCETVAKTINKDAGLLGYIFGALDYLYREVRRKATDEATLKLLVDELLKSLQIDTDGNQKKLPDRLVRLLSYNQNAERRDKVGRLSKGFLRNAVGFSSFVDLRPNIASDRTNVADLIPLVQFRIRADSEDDGEEVWIVQMSERALDRLNDAIQDVRKKIEALRRDPALGPRIVR